MTDKHPAPRVPQVATMSLANEPGCQRRWRRGAEGLGTDLLRVPIAASHGGHGAPPPVRHPFGASCGRAEWLSCHSVAPRLFVTGQVSSLGSVRHVLEPLRPLSHTRTGTPHLDSSANTVYTSFPWRVVSAYVGPITANPPKGWGAKLPGLKLRTGYDGRATEDQRRWRQVGPVSRVTWRFRFLRSGASEQQRARGPQGVTGPPVEGGIWTRSASSPVCRTRMARGAERSGSRSLRPNTC